MRYLWFKGFRRKFDRREVSCENAYTTDRKRATFDVKLVSVVKPEPDKNKQALGKDTLSYYKRKCFSDVTKIRRRHPMCKQTLHATGKFELKLIVLQNNITLHSGMVKSFKANYMVFLILFSFFQESWPFIGWLLKPK